MTSIRDSDFVLQGARDAGFKLTIVDKARAKEIRDRIQAAFGGRSRLGPLWERMPDMFSVQDQQAYRRLPEFFPRGPVYLFFDEDNDRTMFMAENSIELVAILGESQAVVTYVSDIELRGLVSMNDHDYFCAAGKFDNITP